MLAWIDLNNEDQKRWAKKYIANKTQINEIKLKSEIEWVEAIERDCDYANKEVSTFIKPMRAAWRKYSVTMSRMIEILLEEKEVQLEIDTSS